LKPATTPARPAARQGAITRESRGGQSPFAASQLDTPSPGRARFLRRPPPPRSRVEPPRSGMEDGVAAAASHGHADSVSRGCVGHRAQIHVGEPDPTHVSEIAGHRSSSVADGISVLAFRGGPASRPELRIWTSGLRLIRRADAAVREQRRDLRSRRLRCEERAAEISICPPRRACDRSAGDHRRPGIRIHVSCSLPPKSGLVARMPTP